MENQSEILIRPVQPDDKEQLIVFFKKAYGQNTVFQDENFLMYYFSPIKEGVNDIPCIIAIDSKSSEIISHYGGLSYQLNLNNKIIPMVWGVNTYTLPEWRGKGLNTKIVDYIHNTNIINAVIGMPFDAPFFYQKYGYNIFNKETLTRYVYVLTADIFEVVELMQQNVSRAKEILTVTKKPEFILDAKNIVKITTDNVDSYTFDFDITNIATTVRDHNFLKWRIFNNPYIDYQVFAYVLDNKIKSYIIIREEVLEPQKFKVARIIDLFGCHQFIPHLINYCKNEAIDKNYIYIDFSAYGVLYENELLNSDFIKLENEDYSLLPQVTAPIENRPNHEFIVIQSKKHADEISKLDKNNAYFTRLDADRDRIGRISQIKPRI